MKTDVVSNRIDELKKLVSTLEWDMLNIRNNDLSLFKEKMLKKYKSELNRLLYSGLKEAS